MSKAGQWTDSLVVYYESVNKEWNCFWVVLEQYSSINDSQICQTIDEKQINYILSKHPAPGEESIKCIESETPMLYQNNNNNISLHCDTNPFIMNSI